MYSADLPPFLQEPDDGASKRRAKRDSLFLLISVTNEQGEARGRARVRNLSATGLMADCERVFAPEERVIVQLRGVGDVKGKVCWVRDDRIGIAFDQTIDPQAARKPVGQGGASDVVPDYLRPVPPIRKFGR